MCEGGGVAADGFGSLFTDIHVLIEYACFIKFLKILSPIVDIILIVSVSFYSQGKREFIEFCVKVMLTFSCCRIAV